MTKSAPDSLQAHYEKALARIAELEASLSELQQAALSARQQPEIHRILLDESSDPIFMFAADGTYRYVNRAFADGVNRPLESILHHKIWDVFPPDEADKRYAVVQWVFENAQTRVIEVRVPRPDGDRFYITTAKPVFDEHQQVSAVICISKEITERKQMEDELRRLSTFDLLTGLYNRNYFETEIERIQKSRFFPLSIVMVDVNNLKAVNDSQGHAAGDELIRQVAEILRDSFRAEDLIARFGGDEFVVLLKNVEEDSLVEVIQRLRENVQNQANPHFSLSIGYASREVGATLDEVLRQADDRMYEDKTGRPLTRPPSAPRSRPPLKRR